MKLNISFLKWFAVKTLFLFLIGEVICFRSYGFSRDPHSYSNPEEVLVTKVSLDLQVSFEQQTIAGDVVLQIQRLASKAPLVLDTMDLDIKKIELKDTQGHRSSAKYELGASNKILGSPLTIELMTDTTEVVISYSTSKAAKGLQWIGPLQTSSHRPMLVTQSQPIGARTWIPCQDTPQVRTPYSARISVPKNLLALMTAENPKKKNATGVYQFNMPQSIPSYLISLAVGDFHFAPLGVRTGVYSEAKELGAARSEFVDLERILQTTEKLFGPYLWGRYDVLVMPFSFPYGGMENPRLTFVSPTVIAGDRSLIYVLAHEIAHSWSGNLTTNATWNDFWLNEATTTYFEKRIIEALYGKERAEIEWGLGYNLLEAELEANQKEPGLTQLHTQLEGRDPEDGFNSIPYQKGSYFFYHLERELGREWLDLFWKQYFKQHEFKSVTTFDFISELQAFLPDPDLFASLQIDEWVFKPGLPSGWSRPKFSAVQKVLSLAQRLAANESVDNSELAQLNSRSLGVVLGYLLKEPKVSQQLLKELNQRFHLTERNNVNLKSVWFQLLIKNDDHSDINGIANFLKTTGRTGFIVPIYALLLNSNDQQFVSIANEVFKNYRRHYFPITQERIARLFNKN